MARVFSGISHTAGAVLAVLVLALAVQFASAGTKRTSVPWLLGLSEAQAEKRLENRALEAEVLERPKGVHRLPERYRVKGQIVFQDYRRGITLPTGSKVRVMVYGHRAGRHRRD
jgi:beta-lactam-binding protein with PASTA domain